MDENNLSLLRRRSFISDRRRNSPGPSTGKPGSHPGRILCGTPVCDRQEADEHGHFFFMGKDQAGHEVFLTARRSRPGVLENIFTGLAEIFGIPEDDYYLVNVMGEVNLTMKLGGFLPAAGELSGSDGL